MIKLERKKILLAFLLVWVILWANFTVRDLTKKKYFKDYKVLLSRDAAGKAAYTYGDRFFEFLKFCEKSLPSGVDYDLAGIKDLDWRRAVYYLYPHLKKDKAPYVLVFDEPGYVQEGYAMFKELDSSRFILKRI